MRSICKKKRTMFFLDHDWWEFFRTKGVDVNAIFLVCKLLNGRVVKRIVQVSRIVFFHNSTIEWFGRLGGEVLNGRIFGKNGESLQTNNNQVIKFVHKPQ